MASYIRRYGGKGYTVTFGDVAENHAGMQGIGALATEGISEGELRAIGARLHPLGLNLELYELGTALPPGEYSPAEANVLIIRNGLSIFLESPDLLWTELIGLTHDSTALMRGRVVNKHARHNLCFSDFDQPADVAGGKGTVINFSHLPYLRHIRTYLPTLLGPKAAHLQAEANYYYDIDKCGIGYHGDTERRIVVAARLGDSFPLAYQWYHRFQPIGPRVDLHLNHGDMYIMSSKAVGFDWKSSSKPTLRHAAGFGKWITPKVKKD